MWLLTCSVSFECIPDITVEVVIPSEEEAATLGEGNRCNTTDNVVMGVGHELLVCAEVKQPACSIVRASGKGIAIGEELERKVKTYVSTKAWDTGQLIQHLPSVYKAHGSDTSTGGLISVVICL